jgi:small subunit ribosomal protein S8
MTMTDPIADLLTQIRNAARNDRGQVDIPHSRVKEYVCRVLKEEGFITDYRVTRPEGKVKGVHQMLHVFLKYGPNGEKVLNRIERVSRPGCRVYRTADKMPKVLKGMGIVVVSTSKGVMSDRECRRQNLGGEVLCRVW